MSALNHPTVVSFLKQPAPTATNPEDSATADQGYPKTGAHTAVVSVFDNIYKTTNPKNKPLIEVLHEFRDGVVAVQIADIRAVQTDSAETHEIQARLDEQLDLVKYAASKLPQDKRDGQLATLAKARDDYKVDRHAKENRDALVKWLKKALPIVTFAGEFDYRNAEGLRKHSGLIVIDGDDLPNANEMVVRIGGDPHCVSAEASPTGTGAKFLIRVPPTDAAGHRARTYPTVAAYLNKQYGLIADESGKDVSRACYFLHDPHLTINLDAVEMEVPDVAPAASTTAKPATGITIIHTTEMRRELLLAIPPAKSGHYQDWLNPIGALQATGASDDECDGLLNEWDPEDTPGLYLEKLNSGLNQFDEFALENIAKKHGWQPSANYKSEARKAADLALIQELESRQFGQGKAPVKPIPRLLLDGIPICTVGNLSTWQSQSKTGKSSVLAAAMASAICAEKDGIVGNDTLGFTSSQPGGMTMLHIDSEQCGWDHWASLRKCLKRSGVESCPSWLKSFRITGFTAEKALKALRVLAQREADGPGLFMIVIDGFGDFVSDVNEAQECNAFVAGLQDMAIRFNCSIVGILHENPGKGNQGEKSRGHLGSQLQRKSETNLVLKRDGEVTTMYAEKTRGAPIMEKHGHKFTWSEADGMHMTVAAGGTNNKAATEIERLRALAVECFASAEPKRTKNLIAHIREARPSITGKKCSVATAERDIQAMKKAGIIDQHDGLYALSDTAAE